MSEKSEPEPDFRQTFTGTLTAKEQDDWRIRASNNATMLRMRVLRFSVQEKDGETIYLLEGWQEGPTK